MKKVVKYIVTAVLAGTMTVTMLINGGFFESASPVERMRCLADAFTVPGLLLVLSWGLIVVAFFGAFDTISYAGKSFLRFFLPRPDTGEEQESYVNYVLKRREGRKPVGRVLFLLIVGAAYMLPGIVFTILHGRM